jgi:hypothetical protein
VADMLLMSTRQISDPVELLIQMVIDDLARNALGLRVQYATWTHSTLFLGGAPKCTEKSGWRENVPFGTDCWEEKRGRWSGAVQ